MVWNWQLQNWPNFNWDPDKLTKMEQLFIENGGIIIGSSQHVSREDNQNLIIELMSTDALNSAEIEGEHLNRDSVQSSIQKELGLRTNPTKASIAERGIAKMMVDLYQSNAKPLTQNRLCDWHRFLMSGNPYIETICYFGLPVLPWRHSKTPICILILLLKNPCF